MSLLNKNYFLHNKGLVLLGASCGIVIAILFGCWARPSGFMFVPLAVTPFITCPLTLRTQQGRLWWSAYCGLVTCLVVVSLVRLPHPLAWVNLMLCAVFGIFTVCLRWSPPSGRLP